VIFLSKSSVDELLPSSFLLEGHASVADALASLTTRSFLQKVGRTGVAIPVPAGARLLSRVATMTSQGNSNFSSPSETFILEESTCGYVDVKVNVTAGAMTGNSALGPSRQALDALIPLAPRPTQSTPVLLSASRSRVTFSLGFQSRPAEAETVEVNCSVVRNRAADGILLASVSPRTVQLSAASFDARLDTARVKGSDVLGVEIEF